MLSLYTMPYVLESQLHDCSFSLEISGYEFPETRDDEYDANWVHIVITASSPQGSWKAKHPVLLTWEIEDLINWRRRNYHLEPLTQFIEPALQFFAMDVDSELVHLQVTLSHELLPEWRRPDPIVLDLIITKEEFKQFASELESELACFPYR